MKTPRNRTSKTEPGSSRAQRKHSTQNAPLGEKDGSSAPRRSGKPRKTELPPNENMRKHADEVYGDTEIPERKEHV
jgi:hypothetical protein